MLPLDALSSMRPLLATPCYGFNTTAPYSQSLFLLANLAGKIGMDVGLEYRGESLIPRSRNILSSLFMADPAAYTHLFFWDADVKASVDAVARLLLADHDVAVGIYPLKQFNWPPVMPPGITQEQFEKRYGSYPFFPVRPGEIDMDGFAEVHPATTGFMCIKRAVIEKMMAAYPERNYLPDKGPDDGLHYDFFDPFIEPITRHYWSEDYGFCHLWNKIGGKVYADVHSRLSHYGQHLFRGDLAEHLQWRASASG